MKTGQCRARHDQTRQDKGTLDLLSEAIIYIGLSQAVNEDFVLFTIIT